MDRAIPDGLIARYEALIEDPNLPDGDDRHVLVAAIRCSVSVIVTFNHNDFPSQALAPYGIEAQHPDQFVENLFDLDPGTVLTAAKTQRAQIKKSPDGSRRVFGNVT